ncbi:MAG TPA: FAD-binding protein [Myxococcaceae bacterium]|nr:FAD-binding protein [Myxococcaceae bacterium]
MHRPNRDGNGWRRFDPESVANTEGGIHHRASIVQNLRAIAEDLLHVLPDRMVLLPVLARGDGPATATVALLVGVVQDVLELLAFPFMLVKNLVDIAAHAVCAAGNGLRGESDGDPLPVPPFDVSDPDSSLRLLLGLDRACCETSQRLEPLLDLEAATARWRAGGGTAPPTRAERLASFNGDVRWSPRLGVRLGPGRDELCALLRWIRTALPPGTRIKAGGGRHSHGAGRTDGVYLHPDGLRFLEPMPPRGSARDTLRPAVQGRAALFRVGSGVLLRELNAHLWRAGWALPVIGGYDGQTLAGAITTGTHGTVLGQGTMAARLRSLDLVLAGGTALRVEPALGITDPARLRQQEPGLRLVQDDDLFRAAIVNLGAFGVIHSMVVQTVPRFYLEERTTESNIAEVAGVLAGGNVYHLMEAHSVPGWASAPTGAHFSGHPHRAYALSVLFNPHTGRAQVCTSRPVQVGFEPFDLGLRVERVPAKAFARDARFVRRPVLWRSLIGAAPRVLSRLPALLSALRLRSVPEVVDWSVRGSSRFINRCYNVFHCGEGTAGVRVRFGEFFVPLREDRFLLAIGVLVDAARRWSARVGTFQTGPTNVRFVRGGTALLGPLEDFAALECLFVGAPAHTDPMMRFYKDALARALGSAGFSMHFGMQTPGWTAEEVLAQHPGYARWRALRDALDPTGSMLGMEQEALLPPVDRDGSLDALQRRWAS